MRKRKKIQFLFFLLLTLLFLCLIPAVSYGNGRTEAGTGNTARQTKFMSFPKGTTVKSLRLQLVPQGCGYTLLIREPDGTERTKGEIESGDVLTVLDRSGCPVSRFTVKIEGESSPDSSDSSPSEPSSAFESVPASSIFPSKPSNSSSSPKSGPTGSGASSSKSAGTSKAPIEADTYSIFSEPVTMDSIYRQLESEYGENGFLLKVKTASGAIRNSGSICTGDVLNVYDRSGTLLCKTTAVVLGDLTRCGRCTERGRDLLYGYLIHKNSLKADALTAADLNQDGSVDTADLLQLKKELAGSS
jgi:hypothetical protein